MNFEHVAKAVSSKNEIRNFYMDVFEMKEIRHFNLDRNLANEIFGINTQIPVYLLNSNNLSIEIFVFNQNQKKRINHICFSTNKREKFIDKAKTDGYKCIQIKREPNDLVL